MSQLGTDKSTDAGQAEFVERRRASLERYMNRTAAHPVLRSDPDFREFLELGQDFLMTSDSYMPIFFNILLNTILTITCRHLKAETCGKSNL